MRFNGTAVLATLLAWNGPTAVVMLCAREREVNARGGNVSRRGGNVPRCQTSSFMWDWTGLENCQGVLLFEVCVIWAGSTRIL
jgi:hypothetical protein